MSTPCYIYSFHRRCVLQIIPFIVIFIGCFRVAGALPSSAAVYEKQSNFQFSHPLVLEGYPPAVNEFKSNDHLKKPMLLYLPGFDGTLVCPFLQFPELGTEFDVRGLSMEMSDRSTFVELRDGVVNYILSALNIREASGYSKDVYLMGESFGSVLACAVSLELSEKHDYIVRGLVLINPATSYMRSQLYLEAPLVANHKMPFYLFGLIKLLPMFADEYQFDQLLLMLSSEALPSIIDTPQRESYMGRVAFSLANKLKFMPRDALFHRLTKWLEDGNKLMTRERLSDLSKYNIETLIVVGERDKTLPSVEEASDLQRIIKNSEIHIVNGAGHSSTSGSRVDLTALMRGYFTTLQESDGRKEMKVVASNGKGKYYGMEVRDIPEGLSPLLYWSKDLYQSPKGLNAITQLTL